MISTILAIQGSLLSTRIHVNKIRQIRTIDWLVIAATPLVEQVVHRWTKENSWPLCIRIPYVQIHVALYSVAARTMTCIQDALTTNSHQRHHNCFHNLLWATTQQPGRKGHDKKTRRAWSHMPSLTVLNCLPYIFWLCSQIQNCAPKKWCVIPPWMIQAIYLTTHSIHQW